MTLILYQWVDGVNDKVIATVPAGGNPIPLSGSITITANLDGGYVYYYSGIASWDNGGVQWCWSSHIHYLP